MTESHLCKSSWSSYAGAWVGWEGPGGPRALPLAGPDGALLINVLGGGDFPGGVVAAPKEIPDFPPRGAPPPGPPKTPPSGTPQIPTPIF